MFTVYVMVSERSGRRYVGCTSKTLKERLSWHQRSTTSWTRNERPFKLVHSEEFSEKSAALRREKYFKTGQGRKTVENILTRQVKI